MRNIRTLATAALALTLVVAAAACSKPDTIALPDPSSTWSPAPVLPSVSSSSSASTGLASPTQPASASPSGTAPWNKSSGIKEASAEVSAKVGNQKVSLSFDTVIEYPLYYPPDGEANVTWSDGTGNALVIGTPKLFLGTKATSSNLGLQLVLVQPKFETFNSGDGSCRITFDKTEKNLLTGSYKCVDMKGDQKTKVDASGTFSAHFG